MAKCSLVVGEGRCPQPGTTALDDWFKIFLKKHAPSFLWRLLRISLFNTLASVTYFSCPKVSNAPISKYTYTYFYTIAATITWTVLAFCMLPPLLPLPLWQPKRASTSALQLRHSPAWLPTTLRIKSKLPPAFWALWHLDLGSVFFQASDLTTAP